jgi:DNA-binding NarL/FixJ family response regulator
MSHTSSGDETDESSASRGVLLLEDDDDTRAALVELVQFLSARPVVAVRSLGELWAARERAMRCELAILDVNLGDNQPSGIDAWAWLKAERFRGRVVFLTGHGDGDPRVRATGVALYRKPITVEQLRELLREGALAAQ